MRAPKHLMRITVPTDATDDEPEYQGSFSGTFIVDDATDQIIDVDWSVRGEVTITYMVNGERKSFP